MPKSHPIYFEGDISIEENNPFGIFEAEITAPDNLDIPILQLRFKSENGVKTISPLGKWTSWYFSKELENLKKFGYSYQIKRGYIFEPKYIFRGFVDFLYDLKVKSARKSANYTISKMLLNSLYGRLGMNPKIENHIILPSEQAKKYYNLEPDIIPLKNGKELISFYKKSIFEGSENLNYLLNISVPISTAVTSYGRMYMSEFKLMFKNLGITLFYSDTDNLDIDQELDQKYIGRELGELKWEHTFDK